MVKKSNETLELRNNKCFTYLLPLLGDKVSRFKNCSGVFFKDIDRPDIKNKVHLLFRMDKEWSDKLHEWLIKLHLYDSVYDVVDDYKMYVYNLPEGYKKNYHLFISGKFSQMDDEYKRHILNFHKDSGVTDESIIHVKRVLYKDEKLYEQWEKQLDVVISREQEISSIPGSKDIFKLSDINL